MSPDDFIKGQVALLAWQDGHEHGTNAMIGILHVVANVAKDNGGDWLKAIQTAGEESGSRNDLTPDFDFPDIREPGFQSVLTAVDSVYDGKLPDRLTDGARFYRDSLWTDPPEDAERIATVGGITFYR